MNQCCCEKVVYNEELMEPVLCIRSSKYFKTAWKKKNAWGKVSSALWIDIVSAKASYNTIKTSFAKQEKNT